MTKDDNTESVTPSRQLFDNLRSRLAPLSKFLIRIRGPLRGIWIGIIFIFVIKYLAKNSDDIRETIKSYDLSILVITVGVTLIGKLILNFQCQLTTRIVQAPIEFQRMLWMYSISDMAKYVPGGIWNAVARVRMYTNEKMTTGQASRAFALEKYWQILGALFTGLIACSALLHKKIFDSQASVLWLIIENISLLIIWIYLSYSGARRITGYGISRRATVRSIVEQIGMALFLGAGLWFPLWAIDAHIAPLVAIGAFSLGRAAGYLAIFAPAGIGVREIVALWAIFPNSQVRHLVIVALGINRIMTFVSDLSGFAIAFGIRRVLVSEDLPKLSSTDPTKNN